MSLCSVGTLPVKDWPSYYDRDQTGHWSEGRGRRNNFVNLLFLSWSLLYSIYTSVRAVDGDIREQIMLESNLALRLIEYFVF